MNPINSTVKKVKDTISRYRMIEPGDKVIIALSGGPDSVTLLDIMDSISKELDISLVVAHFNHGLRDTEDEAETRLVRDISESMGLSIEIQKASHLTINDSSIEEKAREARYRFLESVMEKHGAQKIAMGHNLNDQAETVLMRILRGSGPSGLAGIPPVRDGRIIRPLIGIKREEIMSYLKERELKYAIDSSNRDTKYLRNRIRIELLPMMLDYQPQLIDQLSRLSNIIRDEDSYMESMALDWIKREVEEYTKGHVSLQLSSFKVLPPPFRNRVARSLLKQIGSDLRRIEYDHIISVSNLVDSENPQSIIDLPNGIIVRKTYDRLSFVLGAEDAFQEYSFTIKAPGTFHLNTIGRTIKFEELEGGMDGIKDASNTRAYLDATKIHFPLIIRNFRPGDRFVPLGMKGHKKVKDFFIDMKIPAMERSMAPILTSEDTLVWICGYRIDDRFKVTPNTERLLKASIT
jgi:tRNA(Ile)-lysidine synthase